MLLQLLLTSPPAPAPRVTQLRGCAVPDREALVSSLGRVASCSGEVVVVKYGGHAMTDASLAERFSQDIALLQALGVRAVVVHGGGPQIGGMLKRLNIESSFVAGLRVTDAATMEVAEMVLCGSINKRIAAGITLAGGRAVGLSGKDDGLVRARRKQHIQVDSTTGERTSVDLGLVGEPDAVRVSLLQRLLDEGVVPVIAPVALGDDGASFNINADTMAGAVASALGAHALLLLTDVAGVLSAEGELLPRLTVDHAHRLVQDGTATGGMIPKIGTAIEAVKGGVRSAVVMDGRVPHCALLHLFGDGGVGTSIVP